MLRISTFGGLLIEREQTLLQLPTQKARDLVAYLVTFRRRRHPRAVLAGLLWPDLPEEKARRRLSDTLWRVRRSLGDYVQADEEFIWFNIRLPFWLDVSEFEQGIQESLGDAFHLPRLASCIRLYRGPFLDGLYHDWVLLERERLRGLYLEALGRLLEMYKQTGDYTAALVIAQRLIAVEPLQEAAHRELMRLYHLLGRDAEAIAQYHRCRRLLEQDLGVLPAPETESLYQVLLRRFSAERAMPLVDVHLPVAAGHPLPDLGEPPLVGRDAERASLLAGLEDAARGQGSMVLVEGEAGIGKTRLVQEIIAGAEWRNMCVLTCRGEEVPAASYGLLVSAMQPVLTPLRIRQIARLIGAEHLQAAALLFPLIARILPESSPLPEEPPPQARRRLQEALVSLIRALCTIRPCLWVMEDIQWADRESLALLPLLLPHVSTSRLFFLLTGRSVELRASPAVWDTLQALDRTGPFPRYVLGRLDRREVEQLIHRLLGEESSVLTDSLMQESEGIPLYLVETLKTWWDEGLLIPTEQGVWRWTGEEPVGPSSRRGEEIIGRRLARLSSIATEFLAVAAVAGTEMDLDLVFSACAFSAEDAASLDAYLQASDELLQLGLLIETEEGYRFSHGHIRRVVYGRMSPRERQRLHLRVAQAMEAIFPDRYEELAHHFAAAGEKDAAVRYLRRAAERARALFAHRTALSCYDRLLELLPSDDQAARYDVLRDRAEVLGWLGEREAQGRVLEEMIRLARALSDSPRLALALYWRSEWHRLQGHYGQANEDAHAALDLYRRLGDDRARARLLSQLGRNVLYIGECEQAEAYFREALPILEEAGDLKGQIECRMGLAHIAQYRGDHSTALSFCRRCLTLAKQMQDRQMLSHTLSAVGLGLVDLGDMEGAEPYLQRALEVARESGEKRMQAVAHIRLAYVALNRGDLDNAFARLRTALPVFRKAQDPFWEAHVLSVLGEVELLRGHPEAAYRHLEAACRLHEELGEHDNRVIGLSYLAVAELALGRGDRAWKHARDVLRTAEEKWSDTECCPEVPYNGFLVAQGTRHWAAARAALERAARVLEARTACIADPAWRETYRTGLRVHRAIVESASRLPPPGKLEVRLARADAAPRGPLAPEENVTLIWTVDAGREDADLLAREGKVALRRRRILRLLAEAESAGAVPTIADLAGALDVSVRTIRADLAALRRRGYVVRTRGTVSSL